MSHHHSPPSSAGMGPSSSPFAGTDPTLYSPDMARNARPGHRRQNVSQVTVIASEQPDHRDNGATGKQKAILPVPAGHVQGTFANELPEDHVRYVSRYQFVSRLPDGTAAGTESELELFTVQHQMKLYACFNTCVPFYARGVHLRFDDLHDAAEAKDILEQHDFAVEYISGYDFAIAKTQETSVVNEFEGQIKLTLMIEPHPDHANFTVSDEDLASLTKSVEITAGIFGAPRNCVHIDSDHGKMLLEFRIEFYSIDAAHRAVQSLRLDPIWGMSDDKTFQWFTSSTAHWAGEHAPNSPHRNKPRVDDHGRLVGYRPAIVDKFVPHSALEYRHPADQHNRVRRERILDGGDVRTTIMLRNIPNKLDWMSLKAILDNICFGTYDFLYLRIDFKTGCNVGYAFINFSDVRGMISLIDHIEGHPWAGFRSSKAAEISYATIQGREALVSKFRNSSVMQETPFCRPRLFYTYAEAEVIGLLRATGTEQGFPRPDNLSKLQRSMDSARSIGLYPPHGFTPIAEHRTRTSTYDRGTPRDMVQTAAHFARQRNNPMPFGHLPETKKREIEAWYSWTYGHGHIGLVPFEYIPLTHVHEFFYEGQPKYPLVPQVPGVIGGPVGGPYGGPPTGPSNGTPPRGPRGPHGSLGHNNNPFM
ncbi:hypothetical protein T440DRAFT_275477 [Plenodomus tracheiphilus IPT5]|uniref:RRM domain-containing protein n=1 Tax=Plenodomus tracheiphilus IPT5 TaxID=1408161 RepID=A0A6A7BFY4_9PLEO|nr:hypothetical protein T440DRAFT_275477 [Plenodomus tracheiphilus IPT5]